MTYRGTHKYIYIVHTTTVTNLQQTYCPRFRDTQLCVLLGGGSTCLLPCSEVTVGTLPRDGNRSESKGAQVLENIEVIFRLGTWYALT